MDNTKTDWQTVILVSLMLLAGLLSPLVIHDEHVSIGLIFAAVALARVDGKGKFPGATSLIGFITGGAAVEAIKRLVAIAVLFSITGCATVPMQTKATEMELLGCGWQALKCAIGSVVNHYVTGTTAPDMGVE